MAIKGVPLPKEVMDRLDEFSPYFWSRYYDQLKEDLKNPRSLAYDLIRKALIEQGRWKYKDRGTNRSAQELKARPFTALNIQAKESQQVKWYPDEFSDGI